MPHPLAGITLVGAMGWVYAVAEALEQPEPPRSVAATTPPVREDGEPLLKEALRLKIEGYRYGRS